MVREEGQGRNVRGLTQQRLSPGGFGGAGMTEARLYLAEMDQRSGVCFGLFGHQAK